MSKSSNSSSIGSCHSDSSGSRVLLENVAIRQPTLSLALLPSHPFIHTSSLTPLLSHPFPYNPSLTPLPLRAFLCTGALQ